MAFDIKTFCYITDAFEKKGKFEADYRHGGLNIFYAAKGSCSVVSHGKNTRNGSGRYYLLRRHRKFKM